MDHEEAARHAAGQDRAHGHWHGSSGSSPSPLTARRLLMVVVPAALLVAIAMALLWPRGGHTVDAGEGATRRDGEVVSVSHQPCPTSDQEDPGRLGPTDCGVVRVRITGGPSAGSVVDTNVPEGPGAPTVKPGDDVVLIVTEDEAGVQQYQIIDHQRGMQLWLLLMCFAAAIVAFGRWRGLTALAGLAVTFAVLLYFIVPAILAGRSPLAVAIVGSAAIMLVVLYLTHGLNTPTTVAVLGVLTSLCLAGGLAELATSAVRLTGIGDEQSTFLTQMYRDVNMRGLLLAGILIGSLGVLDDVAVTQAYTVAELADADRSMPFARLYQAATRVGRAHIASVVNTIVLAYAGASLPLLLLLTASNLPAGEVLTSQLIAEEIVRSVVGTLGLVAAVPITTALAAYTATRAARGRPAPEAPVTAPHDQPRHRAPARPFPPRRDWDWDDD